MTEGCECLVHGGKPQRRGDQHMYRWEGNARFLGLARGGKQPRKWLPDGEGPLKIQCPCCDEVNELGPEQLEPGQIVVMR